MGQRVQLVSQWEDSVNAKRVFMAENVTNVLLDTLDSVPMAAHVNMNLWNFFRCINKKKSKKNTKTEKKHINQIFFKWFIFCALLIFIIKF